MIARGSTRHKAVVDSSVVIKWFVVEPHSAEARSVLDRYRIGELNLLAPDLIHAEVGNIVWKKHRFGGLDAADAQQIIDTFRRLTFRLTSSLELLDSAYRLAVTHGRTVYDALYIALALREGCAFVTADEKLVNVIRSSIPNVIWLPDWSWRA